MTGVLVQKESDTDQIKKECYEKYYKSSKLFYQCAISTQSYFSTPPPLSPSKLQRGDPLVSYLSCTIQISILSLLHTTKNLVCNNATSQECKREIQVTTQSPFQPLTLA